MPETRKAAAGAAKKEESEELPGHVARESPEMAAIRLLHASFVLEQQRADDRRADADRRRVLAEQEAAYRRAAADAARRDHELKMAAMYADIAAKLQVVGTAAVVPGAPAGVPPGAPPGPDGPVITGVKAFDISKLDPLPASAKFRDFRLWRDAWEANGNCHKLRLFTRVEQVFTFLQAVGVHAAHVLKVHFWLKPDDDTTTVAVMLAWLQEYYRANRSITVDGVRFAERFQRAGERFYEFRFALDELAKDAELCEHCEDRRIREQLVLGMRDQEVKRELLRHKALTLDVVVDMARSYEAAAANSAVGAAGVRRNLGELAGVDAVRTAYKERQREEVAAKAAAAVPAARPRRSSP